jgi:hypothetical protein
MRPTASPGKRAKTARGAPAPTPKTAPAPARKAPLFGPGARSKAARDTSKATAVRLKKLRDKKKNTSKRIKAALKATVLSETSIFNATVATATEWYTGTHISRSKGQKVTVAEQERVLAAAFVTLPALCHVGHNPLSSPKRSSLITWLSETTRLHHETVRKIVEGVLDENELPAIERLKRGKASVNHPGHLSDTVKNEIARVMRAHVLDAQNNAGLQLVHLEDLASVVRKPLKINISTYTVESLLDRAGIEYGKITALKDVSSDVIKRTHLKLHLIVKFNNIYNETKAGTAVMGFSDETHVQSDPHPTLSFHIKGDPAFRGVPTRKWPNKITLLHVMTPDGFLTDYVDGLPIRTSPNETSTRFTAEYFFMGKDYSLRQMEFNEWITRRLIPAFKKVYPDKKVYVLFDNAPYHTAVDKETFFDVWRSKRDVVIAKLEELGCTSFQYINDKRNEDGGIDFVPFPFAQRNKKAYRDIFDSMSDEVLKLAALQWILANHPELVSNQVENLLRPHNIHAVWNVSMMSQWNIIELGWAGAKQHVAENYKPNRTSAEIVKLLQDGMYTKRLGKEGQQLAFVKDDPADPTSTSPRAVNLLRHLIDDELQRYIDVEAPIVALPPEVGAAADGAAVGAGAGVTPWVTGKIGTATFKAHQELARAVAKFGGTRYSEHVYTAWLSNLHDVDDVTDDKDATAEEEAAAENK